MRTPRTITTWEQLSKSTLSRIMTHMGQTGDGKGGITATGQHKGYGVMSAHRSHMTDNQKAVATSRLHAWLRQKGYGPIKVHGAYRYGNGVIDNETSFFVPGMSRAHAEEARAAKYMPEKAEAGTAGLTREDVVQESVLHAKANEKPELVYHDRSEPVPSKSKKRDAKAHANAVHFAMTHIKHPGIRGGKYHYDSRGRVRYGEKGTRARGDYRRASKFKPPAKMSKVPASFTFKAFWLSDGGLNKAMTIAAHDRRTRNADAKIGTCVGPWLVVEPQAFHVDRW